MPDMCSLKFKPFPLNETNDNYLSIRISFSRNSIFQKYLLLYGECSIFSHSEAAAIEPIIRQLKNN